MGIIKEIFSGGLTRDDFKADFVRVKPKAPEPMAEQTIEEPERSADGNLPLAIHEAGHCLIAHCFGRQVKEARIGPDGDSDEGGSCTVLHPLPAPNLDDTRAAIDLGGIIAELLAYGKAGREIDLDVVQTDCRNTANDVRSHCTTLPKIWDETERELSDKMPAVRALADLLLKKKVLRGEEIHQFFRDRGIRPVDMGPLERARRLPDYDGPLELEPTRRKVIGYILALITDAK